MMTYSKQRLAGLIWEEIAVPGKASTAMQGLRKLAMLQRKVRAMTTEHGAGGKVLDKGKQQARWVCMYLKHCQCFPYTLERC